MVKVRILQRPLDAELITDVGQIAALSKSLNQLGRSAEEPPVSATGEEAKVGDYIVTQNVPEGAEPWVAVFPPECIEVVE